MKTFIAIVLSVFVVVSLPFYVFAVDLTLYHFPDPSLDGNFVIASETLCKVYYVLDYTYGVEYGTNTEMSGNYNYEGSFDDSGLIATLYHDGNNNRIVTTFTNFYNFDITVARVNYYPNGTIESSLTFIVPALGSKTSYMGAGSYQTGFYSAGFILDASMLNLPLGNISFSNTLDYSTEYTNMVTLLNSIKNYANSIYNQDSAYYPIIGKFLQDFFYEDNLDHDVVIYNWSYYCQKIDNFAYNMALFARDFNDWYHNYYNPKTDQTNDLLQDILDYLSQQVEEVTIEDSMSGFHEMESAKDDLKVTDENGSEIKAGDQAEVVFSEAASDLDSLSPAVLSVNGFIEDFIFAKPILLIPLVVGLALGLIVTILGKNKSD